MEDLEGDARVRVHYSEILWVVTGGKNREGKEIFGIQDSIQRVVCTLEGYSGKYVRYRDHYYPLHSKAEFEEMRKVAISESYMFYSNHHGFSQDNKKMRDISSASFIYEHEMGPLAI
ncbi:hypothetical protein [Marinobacter goseongensis]|uniref:hypothetical protein n=1 Tax=Marinobacter goseongensis TaxID=453838 RepID=UPI002005129A|nr:hypothetical protein [Marinobacter goseongensis]MCK7550732.1 hypothetical protein [Marinobacter goseongensis]